MSDATNLRIRVREREFALRAAITELSDATGEPYIPVAPVIDQQLLDNCKLLKSRYDLLELMPKRGVCVEIGTQYGHFAKDILKRTAPSELHVIDISFELFDRISFNEDLSSGRVRLHQGDSSTIIASFPENYFDWIYIDAEHTYQGFLKDLIASARVVKPNGFILCNDYTTFSPPEVFHYGVLKGVNEFCVENRWPMRYFALHSQGYHDVCLQKPSASVNSEV